MSMVPPMEDLVVAKLPKFPSHNEGGFCEELQAMHVTCFGKSFCEWKAVIPGEIDGAPALSSKRAFK